MSKKHRLADLHMAIMQVLWEKGEATVANVRESLLPGRELAYTTVGTMLTKMELKGQLTHRVVARVNVYKPAIKPDQVKRRMLTDLAEINAADSQEGTRTEGGRMMTDFLIA